MNCSHKVGCRLAVIIISLCLLILPLTPTTYAGALSYTVKDIAASDPDSRIEARSMNSAGQVVGYLYPVNTGQVHTFVYDNSGLHDIDAELGSSYTGFNYKLSTGINTGINSDITQYGQLIGVAYTPAGDMHTVFYDSQGIHVLGTLGGSWSYPYALNAAGQVAGGAQTADGSQHAFLYSNGLQDLGTLGGPDSVAMNLNNSGQVVGGATISGGQEHAFLHDSAGLHDLGTLGGGQSRAYAINDAGKVVGEAETTNGEHHAFLYDNTGMRDLNIPGCYDSVGMAINSTGQVVGYASCSDGSKHILLYNSKETKQTLLNISTSLYDISLNGGEISLQYFTDSGIVAGQASTPSGEYHAFLYDGAGMHDLTLPDGNYSELRGVNNSGQAVGISINPTGDQHVFLYDAMGLHDLTPDSTYSIAQGINDSGQAIGLTDTPDGRQYVFVYQNGIMTSLNNLTAGSGFELYTAVSISSDGQIICNGARNEIGRALLLMPNPPSAPPSNSN